jgi:hypothetical protein
LGNYDPIQSELAEKLTFQEDHNDSDLPATWGQPKEGEVGVGSIDLHNGEICRPICMLGLRIVSSETKIGWLLGAADLLRQSGGQQ